MPRSRPRRLAVVATVLTLISLTGAGATPFAFAAPAAIEDKREQVRRLQAELADLDARAGVAAAELNEALDLLDLIRQTLRRTEADLRIANRNLRALRRQVSERVEALYRSPEPALAELLLSASSLSELQARIDLQEQITRADARLARTVVERKARLAELRDRQVRERRLAQGQVARAAARRRQVLALVARRREVLSAAEADLRRLMAQERARLRRLAAEKAAREAAARAATGAPYRASAERSASVPGGSHVFPIAGPTTFSDDWLFGRAGGRLHVGIDLFAARGTPVVAVADGSLFRVGYNGLGGWRLWLRDDAGTTFYYAHLDAFAAAAVEGARVSKGTTLGFVGTTGDAQGTSPHLHFEIHPGGGGPVRPYPIVTGWPRA